MAGFKKMELQLLKMREREREEKTRGNMYVSNTISELYCTQLTGEHHHLIFFDEIGLHIPTGWTSKSCITDRYSFSFQRSANIQYYHKQQSCEQLEATWIDDR